MSDELHRQFAALQREFAEHVMRTAELERRMDTTVRHGKVTEVDTKKQLARIEIGERDGTAIKSHWVPYAQFAGPDGGEDGDSGGSQPSGAKYHTPPFVGQQMTMLAPSGEIRQAVLLPFTWSNQAKAPAQTSDHVFEWGKLTATLKKDSLVVSCGQLKVTFTPDNLKMECGSSQIEITPSKITEWAETLSQGGEQYIGQGSAGATSGRPIDIHDGIQAVRVYTN